MTNLEYVMSQIDARVRLVKSDEFVICSLGNGKAMQPAQMQELRAMLESRLGEMADRVVIVHGDVRIDPSPEVAANAER